MSQIASTCASLSDFEKLVILLRGKSNEIEIPQKMYQLATAHGVVGVLLKHCSADDALMRHMRARTILQISEAENLLNRLNTGGIRAVPLKGIDLIERLGLDPATRPMSDIDFLVRTDQRAEAGLELRRLGYERHDAPADILDREQGGAWRYFRRTGDFTSTVEIHDRTFTDSPLRYDDFADTSRNRLTLEAALYWLCRNAAWHGFSERLLFVYDLDRLIRGLGGSLDREVFGRLAAAGGEQRLIYLALRVANRLFDTPVAGPIPSTGPEMEWVELCSRGRRPVPWGPRSLFPILLLDRPGDRFRELKRGGRRLMAGSRRLPPSLRL